MHTSIQIDGINAKNAFSTRAWNVIYFECSAHLPDWPEGSDEFFKVESSCTFQCIGLFSKKLIRGKLFFIKKEFLRPKKLGAKKVKRRRNEGVKSGEARRRD